MMAPPAIRDAKCTFCGKDFGALVDPRTCPDCKRKIIADEIRRIVRSGLGEKLGPDSLHCVIKFSHGVSIVGTGGTVGLCRSEVRALIRMLSED